MHAHAVATAVAFAAGIAAVLVGRRLIGMALRRRSVIGPEATEIERHMRRTQKPARLLGLRVHDLQPASLTLAAPLRRNRNVHGTGFAGSLYSAAVLASFYLGRRWMTECLRDRLQPYTLVARSASIRYRRPVSSDFVAQSVLPSESALNGFRRSLLKNDKAALVVAGTVRGIGDPSDTVSCTYSVELCAYRPDGRR